MLENIKQQPYRVLVLVTKPERKFIKFYKVTGKNGLQRLARYLSDRKPIYFSCKGYKDGIKYNIKYSDL